MVERIPLCTTAVMNMLHRWAWCPGASRGFVCRESPTQSLSSFWGVGPCGGEFRLALALFFNDGAGDSPEACLSRGEPNKTLGIGPLAEFFSELLGRIHNNLTAFGERDAVSFQCSATRSLDR